jgi:putative flippase GtrA
MRLLTYRIRGASIKYLLVGAVTFVTYYIALAFFYTLLGVRYEISIACAYTITVALHFMLNRQYTFEAMSGRLSVHGLKYAVVAFVNYLVQLGVVYISLEFLSLNFYVATFLGVLATLVLGYTLLGRWVFQS